jgi:hypothetical protein
MVSSPASRNSTSQSRTDTPAFAAAVTTSIGLYAWTCIDGTRALMARTIPG